MIIERVRELAGIFQLRLQKSYPLAHKIAAGRRPQAVFS